MNTRHVRFTLMLALMAGGFGCARHNPVNVARSTPMTATTTLSASTTHPTTQAAQAARASFHIHLPGIGGFRGIDRGMLRGLAEGGYDAILKPFDWPGDDAGLTALVATARHRAQSAALAQVIAARAAEHPEGRITVSAHSGGAGIVAWALEQLPPGVQIDTLVLIAPALSPTYDLSPALAHVRQTVYVFYSPFDVAVLGIGTKMLGTVDGQKVEAAGKVGFTSPPAPADAKQYEKLVQVPYRGDWIKLGNIGDHIGGLSRPFAKAILAPLLSGRAFMTIEPVTPLAPPPSHPTSAPSTMPGRAGAGR